MMQLQQVQAAKCRMQNAVYTHCLKVVIVYCSTTVFCNQTCETNCSADRWKECRLCTAAQLVQQCRAILGAVQAVMQEWKECRAACSSSSDATKLSPHPSTFHSTAPHKQHWSLHATIQTIATIATIATHWTLATMYNIHTCPTHDSGVEKYFNVLSGGSVAHCVLQCIAEFYTTAVASKPVFLLPVVSSFPSSSSSSSSPFLVLEN